MPYKRKQKWQQTGDLVTVAVRLAPDDVKLLDGLVAAGYSGEVDPGEPTYYIRKSRGGAIRQAIRDMARAKGVSLSSLPGKRPSKSGWRGKVLAVVEEFPGLDEDQVAEHYELVSSDSLHKHFAALVDEGWIEKVGRTYVPLHPKKAQGKPLAEVL